MSTRYAITGEVDLAVAESLRIALLSHAAAEPGEDLVVDCSNMSFIDSSGLRALLVVQETLRDRAMVLVDVHPDCRRTFEICGLDQTIAFRDSVPSEHAQRAI